MKHMTVESCEVLSVFELVRRLRERLVVDGGSYTYPLLASLLEDALRRLQTRALMANSPFRFRLTTTPMPWGDGVRYWFVCAGCYRHVAKLYMPPWGTSEFLCCHCHGLTYESAQRHNARLERVLRARLSLL